MTAEKEDSNRQQNALSGTKRQSFSVIGANGKVVEKLSRDTVLIRYEPSNIGTPMEPHESPYFDISKGMEYGLKPDYHKVLFVASEDKLDALTKLRDSQGYFENNVVLRKTTLGEFMEKNPGSSILQDYRMNATADGFDRGGYILTKAGRNVNPESVKPALNKLGSISSEAQLALRGVSDADLQSIAKLHQSNPQLVDDLLKQMTFKGQKIESKGGAVFEGMPDALSRLRTSIDNYNIVQKRGYPFGFKSLDEFQNYKTTVVDSLKRYGIPTDNIRIQGSAVHSTAPGDIDVIVSVGDDAFDVLSKQFISSSTQPKVAKQIAKEASKGKIPSYRFATNPAQPQTIGQTLYDPNKLPNQISLIRQGSDFDLGPFLNF